MPSSKKEHKSYGWMNAINKGWLTPNSAPRNAWRQLMVLEILLIMAAMLYALFLFFILLMGVYRAKLAGRLSEKLSAITGGFFMRQTR